MPYRPSYSATPPPHSLRAAWVRLLSFFFCGTSFAPFHYAAKNAVEKVQVGNFIRKLEPCQTLSLSCARLRCRSWCLCWASCSRRILMLREECHCGQSGGRGVVEDGTKAKANAKARQRGEGIKKFPFGFLFGPTKVGFTPHWLNRWLNNCLRSRDRGVACRRVSGKLVCLFGLSCAPLLATCCC